MSLVLDKTSYSYLGLILTLKMSCCGTREQFCATKGAFNTLNFKKKTNLKMLQKANNTIYVYIISKTGLLKLYVVETSKSW